MFSVYVRTFFALARLTLQLTLIPRLSNGGDYLFHCIDDEEMGMWISNINNKVTTLGKDVHNLLFCGTEPSKISVRKGN